jgi:S-adenosylmethionine hydrolase
VLSMIDSEEQHKVRQISNETYFRHPVSRTFHGRDVFGPVAAHLAAGVAVSRMGKLVRDYERAAFDKPRLKGPRNWIGRVLKIDRFGNVVTNFRVRDFGDLGSFSLAIGMEEIRRSAGSYADAVAGELFAIAGSSGYWEVSVNQGSAVGRVGCHVGSTVELRI